jgi:hypothetical protein
MLVQNVATQLMEEEGKKYNVVVNGVVRRASVPKIVAESYIRTLSVNEQSQTSIVPVTSDGKEILFG